LQQGIAAGVDESGRLLLDTDAGRITVAAGDVSLRLQDETDRRAGT
jgi:BirA family biotin operon repressor/biotin-[acetyl-CoA-carboxylase] ligase